MSKKKFIRRVCIKVVLLLLAICVINIFVESVMPTINNDIALGQLENDNSTYAFMSLWNKFAKFMDICKIAITGCCITAIAVDTFEYFKYQEEPSN